MDIFIYIIVALVGLAIGSFLNVINYRYPIMLMNAWRDEAREFLETDAQTAPVEKPAERAPFNIAVPRSHCPSCKKTLGIRHNIPLLSYLFQRGRCAFCRCKISSEYFWVELFTMLLSVLCYYHFGLSMAFAVTVLATWGLVTLFVIDMHHQILPDPITYCILWMGLFANTYGLFTSLTNAVIGAIAGYLSLWIVAKLFLLLRKKEGMGHGDFKMLAMIGAWVGVTALPIALLMSCILSLIFNGTLIATKKIAFDKPTPFGPYLAISAFALMLWHGPILAAVFRFIGGY
jgi:leader peptidase (prepilin peptidase) / N-methyltransferase